MVVGPLGSGPRGGFGTGVGPPGGKPGEGGSVVAGGPGSVGVDLRLPSPAVVSSATAPPHAARVTRARATDVEAKRSMSDG